MITEQEQERLRAVQDSIGQVTELLKEAFGEDMAPEGGIELILGTMLATVDALFAIREGEAWRGMTDPKLITARLLRDAKLGEIES